MKLSISTKLFIGLAIILIPLFASFFGVTLQIVQKDRLAYTYDVLSLSAISNARVFDNFLGDELLKVEAIVRQILSGEISRIELPEDSPVRDIRYRVKESWYSANDGKALSKSISDQVEKMLEGKTEKFFKYEFLPKESLQFLINVNHPKKRDQTVLVTGILRFSKVIGELEIPDQGGFSLVDQAGNIVFSKGNQRIRYGSDFLSEQESQMAESIMVDYPVGDQTHIVNVYKSPENQVWYYSNLRESSLAESTLGIFLKLGLVMVAFVVLGLVLSVVFSRGFTMRLEQIYRATKRIGEGDFDFNIEIKGEDEISSLANRMNNMTHEIKRLNEQTKETARMENELKTAQTVQENLFPPVSSVAEKYQIESFFSPATECGGDWYYYYQEGDRVTLWFGDATGHGAPSAMVTAAVRTVSHVIQTEGHTDIRNTVKIMNSAIHQVSSGQICMTFFMAILDLKTGKLEFCNMGHNVPYIMNRDNLPQSWATTEVLESELNSLLGINPEVEEIFIKEVQLEKGDLVIIYSDGIIEAESADGKQFGERRMITHIRKGIQNGRSIQETIGEFPDLIIKHMGHTLFDDDVSMLTLEVKGIG
jgi:serine phosphatase RsbU (regulator of sigma subunit)